MSLTWNELRQIAQMCMLGSGFKVGALKEMLFKNNVKETADGIKISGNTDGGAGEGGVGGGGGKVGGVLARVLEVVAEAETKANEVVADLQAKIDAERPASPVSPVVPVSKDYSTWPALPEGRFAIDWEQATKQNEMAYVIFTTDKETGREVVIKIAKPNDPQVRSKMKDIAKDAWVQSRLAESGNPHIIGYVGAFRGPKGEPGLG